MSQYRCYKCQSFRTTENMVAYCASCFSEQAAALAKQEHDWKWQQDHHAELCPAGAELAAVRKVYQECERDAQQMSKHINDCREEGLEAQVASLTDRLAKAREAWDYFKWYLKQTYGGPSAYLDKAMVALDATLAADDSKNGEK